MPLTAPPDYAAISTLCGLNHSTACRSRLVLPDLPRSTDSGRVRKRQFETTTCAAGMPAKSLGAVGPSR